MDFSSRWRPINYVSSLFITLATEELYTMTTMDGSKLGYKIVFANQSLLSLSINACVNERMNDMVSY
jgi:hypothetical protein